MEGRRRLFYEDDLSGRQHRGREHQGAVGEQGRTLGRVVMAKSSYEHCPSEVPFLGETIGDCLERTAREHPSRT